MLASLRPPLELEAAATSITALLIGKWQMNTGTLLQGSLVFLLFCCTHVSKRKSDKNKIKTERNFKKSTLKTL
jgi:hypothetical protein